MWCDQDTPDTVQCNLNTNNHAASLHLTLTELVGGTPDTVQCNLNTNHGASFHLTLIELVGQAHLIQFSVT